MRPDTPAVPEATAGPETPELPTARAELQALLQAELARGGLQRVLLSHWQGPQPEPGLTLERLILRPVQLRGALALQAVWRYDSRDLTHNHAPAEALAEIDRLLGAPGFASAHVDWLRPDGRSQQAEFRHRLKGGRDRSRFIVGRPNGPVATPSAAPSSALPAAANENLGTVPTAPTIAAATADDASARAASPLAASPAASTAPAHNRSKPRPLSLALPCWQDLGLTMLGAGGRVQLVPAMARKWKQINHYLEVVGAAFESSGLAAQPAIRVLDFGSGKGYLTFALHAWLTQRGHRAEVIGVELRTGLVELCNAAARRHGMAGLSFTAGDVRAYEPAPVDVMVALHACDTATDHAIHLGLRAGARLIVCSPCCHKQLRPQMKSPAALVPMLRHGIHLGQQAEMVTDTLRALLLDAAGYEAQVFEFVALEHTSKNKMILASRRSRERPGHRAAVQAQIDALKASYGVQTQCLEALMQDDGRLPAPAPASA